MPLQCIGLAEFDPVLQFNPMHMLPKTGNQVRPLPFHSANCTAFAPESMAGHPGVIVGTLLPMCGRFNELEGRAACMIGYNEK
jgi:hypothetical protein